MPAYNFCRTNGITMLSFPPHTSHKLQPLDLTVFGPLKKAYSNECSTFMRQHPHQKITPYDVAEIFNSAFVKIATIGNSQKGFQISGIWPYNPNIFSQEDFLPSTNPAAIIDPDEGIIDAQDIRARDNKTLAVVNDVSTQIQPQIMNIAQINFGANTSKAAQDEVPQRQVHFKELSPLWEKKNLKKLPKRSPRLGMSKILTATPEKENLEQKELKKRTKMRKANDLPPKKSVLKQKQKKMLQGLEKAKKRVTFEDSSSDDSVEVIYNDDSSDDMEEDSREHELCIICLEFGKTETWFQCGVCKKWAHKDCTGQDGSKPYICDFCM